MIIGRFFRTYAEFRRVLQVNRVLFDLVLDVLIARLYILGQSKLSRRIFAGLLRLVFKREKSTDDFPVKFRLTLERLGPTYIKLGQILSLREDFLPERITKELRKLQSQVPAISYEEVKWVVENEFKQPLHAIFRKFDEVPIAAASLAQAHIAYLRSGKKVVVKVQRPGIERIIIDDINIMRRIASLMEKIPGVKEYRPKKFVEEFADYTMREIDFMQEGRHADTFQNNFADDPQIIFPKIYWNHTSRRVLTMQFINGIRPDDTEKLHKFGYNGKKLAKIGARAVIKMMYLDGFFHGDPHPGNMLIVGRSKVAFIDLGMIGSFTPRVRKNFFLYYYYMVIGEFEMASKYMVNLTSLSPNADIESFKRELAEEVKKWSGSNFKDYSMGRLILETMRIGARNQLYFHGDLVLSSKAVLTMEAVGNILVPGVDLAKLTKPTMEKIFADQFSVNRLGQSALKALPDYMDFLEELPNTVLSSIKTFSSGKFQVEVDHKENYSKSKARTPSLTLPFLAAASFIGGVMFAISEDTPGPIVDSFFAIENLPLLSIVSFSIAGLLFLVELFKSRKLKN